MNENKINSPFSETIKKLARQKETSEERIKNLIIKSFSQFYAQKLNREVDFHFEFGDKLLVYRLYQIVNQVSDPEKEVSNSDSRLKEGKREKNTFFLPLELTDSSLDFISEIEQKVLTGLKEVSWESQFKLLQKLQQEEKLVEGNIQGQKGDYYLVNLKEEKVIGFWEKKEWTSTKKKPRLGQFFQFLIKEVREKAEENQPSLVLSRSSDSFLIQVLKSEVPELKEGIIEVRKILRSEETIKLLMESKKKGVDPVGACMGVKAVRIEGIARALFPNKIAIASWVEERKKLANGESLPREVGSYKNIQIRTSEETNDQKPPSWNKKININK